MFKFFYEQMSQASAKGFFDMCLAKYGIRL